MAMPLDCFNQPDNLQSVPLALEPVSRATLPCWMSSAEMVKMTGECHAKLRLACKLLSVSYIPCASLNNTPCKVVFTWQLQNKTKYSGQDPQRLTCKKVPSPSSIREMSTLKLFKWLLPESPLHRLTLYCM